MTYADQPVLKDPLWIWSVPLYFEVGGVAGAAAALGAAAELGGVDGLVGPARRVAAAGAVVGTGLLVADLGRPERFLAMLRVFRPTSPMSVGSWTLAAFTPAALASAATGARGARAAGLAAGVLGLPLSTYTAALVSGTAVPVWRAVDRSLPPLFGASSTAGAGALLEALATDDAGRRVAHRFGLAGKVVEVAALAAVRRDADRVPEVGRALRTGVAGALWRAAEALHTASLALSILPGRRTARRRWADAAVTLAAGTTLRFAVTRAGKTSARDRTALLAQTGLLGGSGGGDPRFHQENQATAAPHART